MSRSGHGTLRLRAVDGADASATQETMTIT